METEGQRKQREHYEKIYQQALDLGPDSKETCEKMKDWYSYQWGEISHIVSAVGGFANFHHFIINEAENRFKTINAIQKENEELEKKLEHADNIIRAHENRSQLQNDQLDTKDAELSEVNSRIKELEGKLKGKDFVFQRALKDINILTNKLEVLTKCDYKTGLMGKEHHVYASCQGCKNKQLLENMGEK